MIDFSASFARQFGDENMRMESLRLILKLTKAGGDLRQNVSIRRQNVSIRSLGWTHSRSHCLSLCNAVHTGGTKF